MKLATLRTGTRDGSLAVVSRDLTRFCLVPDIAPTLQAALDAWDAVSPQLQARAAALEAGAPSEPFDISRFDAPLPRAYEWIDGSAFLNHVILVRKARGAEPPETLRTDPLVYQGGSGVFLGPADDIPLVDPAWGLDFESEVCVILGDVPLGTTAASASSHIKLVLLCNDVTLRNLIPNELAKGFGFFQSKPATAFSAVAVTPDELDPHWNEGRLNLELCTRLNGELVGHVPAGEQMHFSFHDLIQHLARTRAYTAGTILGSGTASHSDRQYGISCLAETRMIETIEQGKPATPFLKVGDNVHIEMFDTAGNSVFGPIRQTVVAR